MGNTSKDKDAQKGKCEAMEPKWSKLQEEMFSLWENVNRVEAFQKEATIHGPHSSLTSIIFELEFSLQGEKKHQSNTTDSAFEAKSCDDQTLISLEEEKEPRDEQQKALDDCMVELRRKVNESLQQTLMNVYKDFNWAIDKVERLHPYVSLPRSKMGRFTTFWDANLVDNRGATSRSKEA